MLAINGVYLNMPEYVRNLSRKVAISDPANDNAGIGNLHATSSSTQLQTLVNTWFRGTDLPSTTDGYQYQSVSGSLFQNGISYHDISQGSVGDCYFLAALAATALPTPDVIQSMFIDNGDGTFTVRFYNKGNAEYVTVDRRLPTYSWGELAYARGGGGSYSSSSNELWVALAEKAYAQLNESGWLNRGRDETLISQDGMNAYSAIEAGNCSIVIPQLTTRDATYAPLTYFSNPTALIDAFNAT